MKPRKRVLLLARSEAEVSFWRLRLDVCGGYRVYPATTLVEALGVVAVAGDLSVVLMQENDAHAMNKLRMATEAASPTRTPAKVLLFGAGAVAHDADMFEPEGTELVARVRASLKAMTDRSAGRPRVMRLAAEMEMA